MNQKLTFTAFLQDEYSKRFDKLAGRSEADIKSIEKNLSKLGKTGKGVTRNIDELNRRIDVLSKVRRLTIDTRAIKFATAEIQRLRQEKERLEGTGGRGTGGTSSVFQIAGGVSLANIAGQAQQRIGQFIKGAAQSYMNYEATVESFKVLTKSDKIGTGLAERLNKWQQDTILGPEVFQSAQTLLSFGIAVDHVEKDLLALGNVSQGNTEKFKSLTLAFAQTQSAGRLMGQDLLQYVNAGFNPLQIISERWKEFGFNSRRSMGQLKKDMEDGKISADMIRKAFELATSKGGLFDGMLEKIGKTSYGKSKQLEGQYEAMKIAIGERFSGEIEDTIGGLSDLTDIVKKWVEVPVSEKIQHEANALAALQAELNSTNITEGRRQEILEKLNSQYSITLKNIGDEKKAYAELNGEINNVINSLEAKAYATSMQEALKDIDDRITSMSNMKANLFRKAFEQAQGKDLFNKEELAAIRTDSSLSQDQKLEKLWKLALSKGYKYSDVRHIGAAAQIVPGTSEGIKRQIADRNEQEALTNEAMEEAGLSGRRKRRQKKSNDSTTTVTGTASTGSSTPSISGSSRITHLVINIDSLIKGGVNIHKATVEDGAAEMKNVVAEQLLTAVNDANLAVSN